MADDNLNVDLDVGSNELEASLRRTFEAMTAGLAEARKVQAAIDNTVASSRQLRREIEETNKLLEKGGTAALGQQAKKDQQLKTQNELNLKIKEEIQLQREAGLATGATREARDRTRLADGRTAAEARGANSALSDAITGINTTTDQIAARLALATGKAMERLLGSTADAIEKSYAVAQQRQMSRNAQLSVPGYLDARVTNDRVSAELAVERAQQGGTLAERRARQARIDNLAAQQADADRREREYAAQVQGYRAAEIRQGLRDDALSERREAARPYADAVYEDRQRTLAANRIRRDAERENADRDRAYKAGQTTMMADASFEDVQRSRARARMQTQAEWENRQLDRSYKAAQSKLYSDASFEDRQRTLAANRVRREAERENADRDRGYRAEQTRMYANAAWENRQFDRERAWQRRNAEQENREFDRARAGVPQRMSLDDRARAGFDQRTAAFNLDGGAQQFAMQARLASNYAAFGLLTGAIRGSLKAVVEFDDNLAQFQAITGAADAEMAKFRVNLLGIAKDSRFSVNELSQVAIALGQTGLAAEGVTKALKPVADLAAASGSTLQQSVQAITGVLGAYNLDASRAGEVADVFVAALNRTKLGMEQLQLGIQYAANIARDSGVSFSELTAAIGAIAQAGVKSGSTIGTGMRQLITELSAPSDKLRTVLKELGIDLSQVDLRTQGFSAVLKTLRENGFGTAEALRSLDLRAAAAFSALAGQTDKIETLQQEFLLTSAAAEASEKANSSLTASAQRLGNVMFGLVDTAFGPLVKIMAAATGGTADLMASMNQLGPTLPIIAAGLSSIAVAFAAVKAVQLTGGLLGMLTGGGVAALLASPVAITALGVGAAGGITAYLMSLQSEAEKTKARLDELKAVENSLVERRQSVDTVSAGIDKTITTLIDRRERLNSEPVMRQTAIIEAQKAFGDLGLAADAGATSIDGLITALQNLRGQMAQEMPTLIAQQMAGVAKQIEELQKLQRIQEERDKNKGNLRAVGPSFMGLGTYAGGDNLRWMRELGPEFAEAAGIVDGSGRKLDENDARGSAAGTSNAMATTLRTLLDSRRAIQLSGDYTDAERKSYVDRLNAQIDLVERAIKTFADKVGEVSNLQGLRITDQRLAREGQTAALRASPEGLAIEAASKAIYGRQDEAIRAAQARSTGFDRYTQMSAAAGSTDEMVRDLLANIEEVKRNAISAGTTKEAARDAFAEIENQLKSMLKGSTKEIRDAFTAAAPGMRAGLQQTIRTNQALLAENQREASAARDPKRVEELAGLAQHYQEVINAARERLFAVEQGYRAEDVVNASSELKEKREQLRVQGEADRNRLVTTYAEIHRRAQQQLLTVDVGRATERKDLIEAQIKGFEKVRDDVRSTPEQAANAVKEINRLLAEVAHILQGINRLQGDKVDLKVDPNQVIAPSVTFRGGSVQQQIVDTLRASGASEERIRYALASGQIESGGYSPDVVSGKRRSPTGATGVFQFMPSTWEKMYGTDKVDVDVGAQIKAFQDYTNRSAGSFRSNMGREATAEELYLMHQQGPAGAMSLLRSGSGSALEALTRARSGPKAGFYASEAITKNGGRLDMTSDEFAALITRKFRAAENTVGNPFTTTGRAESERARQTAADTTAEEVENRKRANEQKAAELERARTLAGLRKEDRSLTDQYGEQLTLAKRVQDPAAVLNANQAAYATLGKLFENARARDENTPDRGGDDDREEARAATRKRFASLYSEQGLNQAEVAGKAQLKKLTEDLDTAIAKKRELERPENLGREGNTQALNETNQLITQLQKQKELQGEYEANAAKIVALEETLRQMKAAGLDTDKDTLTIRERLRDLADQQRRLEPSRNLAGQQLRTNKTFGEAALAGTDNFLKSRGILDFEGKIVDPVVEAQRRLEESLGAIGNAFDNLFVNLFSGTMKAGDALKKFATDILGGLMSSISKSLTNDIMRSLFTGGAGAGGGAGGGLLDGLMSIFKGGMALGGPIRMAGGGGIPYGDAAAAGRDSRLILGMPGGYLLRKSAVDVIGRDTLDQVNALGNTMVNRAPKVDTKQKFGGSSAAASVYVVDRDQVPPPSAGEIVYMIGDNINKGGSLKTLIKRVASGG